MHTKRIALSALALATSAILLSGCAAETSTPEPTTAASKEINAELVSKGVLTVATTGNVPGQSLDTGSGLEGYRIDLCEQIADKLGLKVKYEVLDFASILTGVIAGRYDMTCTGVTVTPERLQAKEFLMTDPDLQNATTAIALAANKRFSGDSLEDGKGLTLGGTRGAIQIDQIKTVLGGDVSVVEYPGSPEMVLDLKNKRIDFYAENLAAASYTVANDKTLQLVDPVGTSSTTTAEAVNKDRVELQKAINTLITEFSKDGTLEKLQKKWYGRSLVPTS